MITVEVTQEDIDKGECVDPWTCAIALALNRATGDSSASVGPDDATIDGVDWLLPEVARDFISKFDHREHVEPFTFVISERVPAWWSE